MFELFDTVKITSNGVIGTIIDKTVIGGKIRYIVESNEKGKIKNTYGGVWPEFDCCDSDLVKIKAHISK